MKPPAGPLPEKNRYSEVSCYGRSMDFYLRSGDRLVIDSAARGDPDSVRPGDIVAYLDWADSPLVSVHRVLWKFRGADGSLRFRTKGDGNLWFDQAIGGAQVLGRVSGVKRSGLPGFEPGRLGGLFAAAYSYAAVLLLRLLEAAGGWLHLAVCLAAAAASRLSFCPPLLRGLLPAALEAGLFCDPNLRTWPRALFSALPGLLARLAPAAELPACAAPAGKFLSGEVRGRLELSGDVTIGGDVTVMPGASLVLLPGVQVRFARAKSDNGRALRAYAGGLLKFRNDKLCRILVYGEFVCAGTAAAPVRLGAADDKWDCLVFLGRSCGTLENAVFSGLAAPLRAMDFSRVKLDKVVFGGGPSALVAAEGCSRVRLTGMELGRASFPLAAGGLARLAVRNCSFTGSATSILVSGLARARLTACRFGGFSAHAVLARDGASVLSSGGACSGGNLPFFGAGQCVMRLRGLSVKGASGSGVTFRGRSLKLSACKVRDCGGGVLLAGKQALLAGSVFSHNRSFAAEVSSGDLAADNCVFETCLSGPAVSFAGRRLDLRVCELRDCTAGLSFSGKTAFISGSVLSGNSGAALQAFHGRLRLSATAARDCAVGLKAGGGAVLTAQELTLERMRSHGVQAEGAASVTVAGGTIDSCGGSAVRAGAGAKVELTGVSLKNCVAGLSLAAGAAAGVERAEILAMVSGAELTGKSRLRLDGSLMRGCAAGVRAENGSLFEAAGFTLEQVKSHGVQAASGARVRLNGAKINSCGGSGVEITGGSGARLAGLEVSGCSVGLSQTGGRAGIKDSRMADIKGSCVSCSGGELTVSDVKFERAAAGFSMHGGASATVDRAELGAMESGVELTGKSGLRFRGGRLSACGAGIKAEGGSRLDADALFIELARAHGVQAGGGSLLRLTGARINSCGGSGVEITGGSGARLAGLEVSGCSVGLSQTGGRAGIKDSRMADIKGSCVSCSGGELTVSDVKFERAEAGLSIHAGGAAGVDRAEILAMVSGAELTGKSRLRLDGSLMRGCAAGVRAEDGSLFEAAGFTLEQVKSHGVQARGGSRLRLSGAKITACGGSGVETAGDSAAELANVEMSGCSAGLSQTGGRAGIKDSRMADIKGSCVSCLGGELAVSGVKLERAGAGLSIHGGAAAGVDQAEIRAMISGVELTGRSSLRLTGGSVSGCARGAWLQEGSAAAASGCLFSDNSGAGIYADSAECAAVSPVFLRNTIGVFADRGAAVTLDKADFSSNQTGIKADNKASVKLTSSVVSGCAWDGVWCGAGASLLLAANRFRNNRYAIKEDGPCSVKSEGNKFENSTAADHLAWPRVEGANRP